MKPTDASEASLSPLELAPYARRSVRGARRLWLALGLVLLALGALMFAILLGVSLSGAARPEDGVPFLAGVAFAVAVLPGLLMTRAGTKRDEQHPLVVALEQEPARVREIAFGHRSGTAGGWSRVAFVSLTDGSAHEFVIPSAPDPDPSAAKGPPPSTYRSWRAGGARASADGTVAYSGRFVAAGLASSGLVGEGSVTVGPSGLVLAGSRERSGAARALGVGVGALTGALTIGVFLELPAGLLDDPRGPAVAAMASALLGWAGTETLLRRALPHAAARAVVAWSEVGSVKQEGGAVSIATTARAAEGISRFVTDDAANLVRACAPRAGTRAP